MICSKAWLLLSQHHFYNLTPGQRNNKLQTKNSLNHTHGHHRFLNTMQYEACTRRPSDRVLNSSCVKSSQHRSPQEERYLLTACRCAPVTRSTVSSSKLRAEWLPQVLDEILAFDRYDGPRQPKVRSSEQTPPTMMNHCSQMEASSKR